MTLPWFMFTVTKVQTIASTVRGHHAWSPYIGEKSCHFNSKAIYNIHDAFAVAILSRTAILSVMNHRTIPAEEWQRGDLYRRRQRSVLDLHERRRVDDLQSCASHVGYILYSRRRSPGGRYNESNYPEQELGRKRGGGRISGTLQ